MLVLDLVLWATLIILIALVGFALRLRRRIITLQNEGLPVTLDAIFSQWPPARLPVQTAAARRMQAFCVEMDELEKNDPFAVKPLPMTQGQVLTSIQETISSIAVLAPFIKRYTAESMQLSLRPYINNAERKGTGTAAAVAASTATPRPLQNFVTSPLMVIQMLISISTHGDGDTRQHVRAILNCKNKKEYDEHLESRTSTPSTKSSKIASQITSQLQSIMQESKTEQIPAEGVEKAETFLRALERTIKTLDYCIERKNRNDDVWNAIGSGMPNGTSGQHSRSNFFQRVLSVLNIPVYIFKRKYFGYRTEDEDRFVSFILDGKSYLKEETPAAHSPILKFKDFDSLTFWFNVPQDALTSQPKQDISLIGSMRTDVVNEVTPTLAGSFNCKAGRPVVSIEPMVGELQPDFSGHGFAFLATDFVCTLGNRTEPDEAEEEKEKEKDQEGSDPTIHGQLSTTHTQYQTGVFVDAYFNRITKEYVTLPAMKCVDLFYVEFSTGKTTESYRLADVNSGRNVFMCLEIPFCRPYARPTVGSGPGVSFSLRIIMQTETSIIDADHTKIMSLFMDWNHCYYRATGDKEAKWRERFRQQRPIRYACTVPKIDFTIPAQNITGILQLASLTRGSLQWQQTSGDSFFTRGAANMPSFLAPPPSPQAILRQAVQEGVNQQQQPPIQSTSDGKKEKPAKDFQIDSRGIWSPATNNPDQPQTPYKLTLDGIGQMARFAIDPQNIGEHSKYMGNVVNVPVCNAFYFGVFCHTFVSGSTIDNTTSAVPLQFGYVAV